MNGGDVKMTCPLNFSVNAHLTMAFKAVFTVHMTA